MNDESETVPTARTPSIVKRVRYEDLTAHIDCTVKLRVKWTDASRRAIVLRCLDHHTTLTIIATEEATTNA